MSGVVVLGGAGGIGSAIVRALLAAGRQVAVVDIAPPPLELAGVPWILGDATDSAVIGAAYDALGSTTGLVHCLLAEHRAPLAEQTSDAVRSVLNIGAVSALEPLQQLLARAGGRSCAAVLVSSIHAELAWGGQAPYAMAKAALEALGRAAAVELGPRGLRCNVVRPGFVMVPRNAHRWQDVDTRNALTKVQPLGELAQPDDIARVVAFLLSDQARLVSGATVTVDGAMTAVLPEPTT
ncbi:MULTISPECIES: SDR family NAD(P)-dependent oxidoreductase [unclassified Crossiella]|uniref:SDR family NAD(P)-dependent oxidoreductase n=1 Tax=unclassified Crossiella TaxID=2620835 RepID=UPI001FFE3099|nr:MULTISPECIES: SDR family oxidoreductase [unclassified Crossiella]MCK2244353.1 SDR family oxidoreductase [Crossiella sp. S99.2]MCK2257819.1 SDR family oxidoreductase [Crossiella sp. S99.1]